MRYDKQRKKSESHNTNQEHLWVLGMLHIVKIKYQRRTTGEMVKQRMLIVGAESADIEKKLRWIYSPVECSGFVVESVEKVREKLHILSTTISEPTEKPDAVIDRGTRSEIVIQSNVPAHSDVTNPDAADITAGWHKYAIGIVTHMTGEDEKHALRRLGRAITAKNSEGKSHSSALPHDARIEIEEVSFRSGYAAPRDVSTESNKAHIFNFTKTAHA